MAPAHHNRAQRQRSPLAPVVPLPRAARPRRRRPHRRPVAQRVAAPRPRRPRSSPPARPVVAPRPRRSSLPRSSRRRADTVMTRLLFIPLTLLGLLALTMAWSGGGVQQRADFAFINRGDIITLDLNQMSYLQDFRVTYGIREGLYTYDTNDLKPVPAGAVGYTLSDDKRVWTFKLSPEAKWTNGDPVVAADYVFSWRRMLEEPGEYTYLFDYIKARSNTAPTSPRPTRSYARRRPRSPLRSPTSRRSASRRCRRRSSA